MSSFCNHSFKNGVCIHCNASNKEKAMSSLCNCAWCDTSEPSDIGELTPSLPRSSKIEHATQRLLVIQYEAGNLDSRKEAREAQSTLKSDHFDGIVIVAPDDLTFTEFGGGGGVEVQRREEGGSAVQARASCGIGKHHDFGLIPSGICSVCGVNIVDELNRLIDPVMGKIEPIEIFGPNDQRPEIEHARADALKLAGVTEQQMREYEYAAGIPQGKATVVKGIRIRPE